MATKTTHETGKAALLAKQLETSKTSQQKAKKKIYDPRRDPGTYTDDELLAMMEAGEIKTPNFSDVRAVARAVLRHRIVTNFNAEAEGVDSIRIIDRLLEEIPEEVAVPKA